MPLARHGSGSCQLPADSRSLDSSLRDEQTLSIGQAICARDDRAQSDRGRANTGERKSLFRNILPITVTGSIFYDGNYV